MAEYYPLLAKAVAGIPNSTPEMRRAVYDRARKALLAQLTNLNPPIPESDIARETQSLDEAVERLEAELANSESKAPTPEKPADEPAAKTAAAKVIPPLSRPMRPPAPGAGAAPRPVLPPRPKAFEAKPFQTKPSEPKPSEPKFFEPKPAGSAKPVASTPPQSAPVPPAARNAGAEAVIQDAAASKAPEPIESKIPDAQEPENQFGQKADAEPFGGFEAAETQRSRSDGPRIYVPQPAAADDARTRFRLWVVGGIVALVVAIVAVAAWGLRDRPGEIAKLKPAAAAKTNDGGKIVARIGGPKPSEGRATAAPTPAPASTQAPSTPAKAAAAGAATASTAAPAAATPAAKPQAAGQTIAVTHRAALLVAVPSEPTKPKVYVGTVVWRLDNVSAGAGQPLGTAVHAEIDVPDDKMKVSLTLQKNTDPSLDVSHTITVVFNVQPDSPTGGIKQINAPQLRADDTAYGQSLAGVPVPIMANSFLIGLTRGNAEKTNLDLIKQRAWFDIPMLLSNGKIAKLTFEKGVSGTRVINEAIAAWQAQGQGQGQAQGQGQ